MSGPTLDDAGSQPSGPTRKPLHSQDFEAQMAPAWMTIGEMLATTPYFDEDEWAGPLPLSDAELDDAIVRLVRLYPGRLGRPRIAHILAGHRGRKIKAKYSHLPDYGRDPFVSLERVRHRVTRLRQTGRLEQRGDNPRRLVPARRHSRPKTGQ